MKKNIAIVFLAVCLCALTAFAFYIVNGKQEEIISLQHTLDTTQLSLNAANTQITTLESEKAALQTTVATTQDNLDTANAQIATLESEKAALQTTVATTQDNLDTANAQIATLESEKATLQTTVDTTQAILDVANTQIATLESEKATLQATVETTRDNLVAANTQITTLESEKANLQNSVDTTQAKLNAVLIQISVYEQEIATIQTNMDAANTQIETLRADLDAANAQIATLEAENIELKTNPDVYVVANGSARGFASYVAVEVTLKDNVITALVIGDEQFAEFEGFGAKALEKSFADQFIGKTCPLDISDIDAITGATYTTTAVIDAINNAFDSVSPNGEYHVAGMGLTGVINVVVTVAEDGKIANVDVRGTDSEYDEPFVAKCDTNTFLDQFVGKAIPVSGIDTVSGATISSKAIIDAVNTIVVDASAGTEYDVKGDGLTGKIDIIVTMADDGTITKVYVKGTDSDIDTSFVAKCQTEAFLGQFVGKTIPVEGIDTVTGATVSSNGIIHAVNTLVAEIPVAGNEYAVNGQGLTGNIDIVVTMNDDGTIAKVDVKGTDSAMDTSFLTMCQSEAFLGQFVGKTIPVKDIDTVVGATVSSNGIIAAVNTVEVAAPLPVTNTP